MCHASDKHDAASGLYGEGGWNYFDSNDNPHDDDYFTEQPGQNRSGIVW